MLRKLGLSRVGIALVFSQRLLICEPPIEGTITGQILDADTQQPVLVPLRVSAEVRGQGVVRTIDVRGGSYSFEGLSPGSYTLLAKTPDHRFPIGRRVVMAKSGHIERADLLVMRTGGVTGTILDSEREPVLKAQALLVGTRYVGGKLHHFVYDKQYTDDRGRFTFSRLESGQYYQILAVPPVADSELAVSSPASSAQATWYPSPPSPDTGLMLKSGEYRTVDLTLPGATSVCVSGQVISEGTAGGLSLDLAVAQLSGYSPFRGGSTAAAVRSGTSGADGSFRICGVWPGEFYLFTWVDSVRWAVKHLVVGNSDVNNVRIRVMSPVLVTGEISVHNKTHDETRRQTETKVVVRLTAADRPGLKGEIFNHSVESKVPGKFSITVPAQTQYSVTVSGLPYAYLQDGDCGGVNIVDRNISIGEGGCHLRLDLEGDLGSVTVSITDEDGRSASPFAACFFPAKAKDAAAMALDLVCIENDPAGGPGLARLRPGEYIAIASVPRSSMLDGVPKSSWINELWLGRAQGVPVTVEPGGSTVLSLKVRR